MSEEKLRERFRALRRDDARHLPGFERTLTRPARGRGRPRPWLWAPAMAAGIGVALALWLPRVQPGPAPGAWSPGRWAMPTDVLLDVPGSGLLRELPELHTPLPPPGGPAPPAPTRRMPS